MEISRKNKNAFSARQWYIVWGYQEILGQKNLCMKTWYNL